MIQCTAFNDNATKYHKLLRLETPYYISKGIIKGAMFKNPRIRHPCCVHLDDNSKVENEEGESIEAPKTGSKKK